MNAHRVMIVALLALAAVFVAWFAPQPSPWAALVVFVLPPLLLAWAALRHNRKAGFWAGVFALGWFSHGVMVAYARAPERAHATAEIILALVIVFAGSLPGLRARFGRKH